MFRPRYANGVDELVKLWMFLREDDLPEPREVTLTVRINEDEYRLLVGLAKYFGRRKSPVAAELLVTAARQAAREIARRDSEGDEKREEEILDELFGVVGEPAPEEGAASERSFGHDFTNGDKGEGDPVP